jgi:hypothetical protein
MRFTELNINEFETFATRPAVDSSVGYGHGGAQARSGGSQAAAAAAEADREARRRAAAARPGRGVPGTGTADTGTPGDPSAPAGTNELPQPDGGTGAGRLVPNRSMNPLFTLNGQQSANTTATAGDVMQNQTLPRARQMAAAFGRPLVINDAIAKRGTSRESQTQGSMHFHGKALDISTGGLTDQQKLQLVQAALQAGFTGFGFGQNILHVDTGSRRHWAYGNSSFGGISVAQLGNIVRSYTPGGTAVA